MKRPTITDVARAAGVSKGAASYALNGRPGVSESTRQRVLAVAETMGFRANSAARMLAGAPSQVVGLTLNREVKTLGIEPFFMELITGVEAELATRSYGLLVQMAPDPAAGAALYRRWWSEGRTDGVMVCDVRVEDQRIAELERLRMPGVVLGPPSVCGSLPGVWSDDAVSATEAVRYLAALGHRRIARVAGIADLAHTRIRSEAFTKVSAELGLTETVIVTTDYTKEGGAQATRDLLAAPSRPTAVIYDNDIMAVTGLAVATDAGLSVPADLSIIAWDDSQICQLVHPSLTALSRDIFAYGAQAARLLLAALGGHEVESVRVAPAHLNPRGTTAPPPAAR